MPNRNAHSMTDRCFTVGRTWRRGEGGRRYEDADAFETFSYGPHGETQVMLAVVADGIGGRSSGDEASRLAIDAIYRYFSNRLSMSMSVWNIQEHLNQAILSANRNIYEESLSAPPSERMGTTVAVAAIVTSEDMSQPHLYVANVGDSRIYLLRNGRLRQITTDHTLAQEDIQARKISPESAKKHPKRHVITRYLGGGLTVEVDSSLCWDSKDEGTHRQDQGLPMQKGDTLLLCTDGLYDVVGDPEIQRILSRYVAQTAADQLVELVRRRKGRDDATVQVVRVSDGKIRLPVSMSSLGIAVSVAVLLTLSLVLFRGWSDFLNPTSTNVALTPTSILMATVQPTPRIPVETPTAPLTRIPTSLPTEPRRTQEPLTTPTLAPTRTPTNTPIRPTHTPIRPTSTLVPPTRETPKPKHTPKPTAPKPP